MKTRRETAAASEREIARIAREVLGVETLATRNADARDFHEIAVWTLKDALEAAYEAGRRAASGRSR